ncbi:MAG: bifunctional phosphoribosylaminoimidazolecarboxamide formyltransferase/IMP cyclohydrolase [Alphaproteobacteria bacterium]|nr:bifunctional phosphoribosylaminoimidazolecarboxamide formyltransferase/IMP cyclohydrolase [Alphaproteobacteria bacterium]
MKRPIHRALISVSDKTGLEPFVRALAAAGVDLVSTGGTAQLIREMGLQVRDVSALTKFPEMMDGRVKTLHPMVHGGLLARRDVSAHVEAMREHGIEEIDLLVVNLYPFEATLNETDNPEKLIEKIDVGGPAMIRAAAKNHAFVNVVTDPVDYTAVLEAIQSSGTTLEFRRQLAAKAFARTASYDSLIGAWMSGGWPEYLLDAKRANVLRYGENPHQQAALYQRNQGHGGLAFARQLQGKELSYNNLADAEAAWQLALSFEQPAVAIIKHANPCGVALGATVTEAFSKALASDPVSAFGGILACNQAIDAAMVDAIGSLFLEVIVAPDITPEAQQKLATKKNLRVLIAQGETSRSPLSQWQIVPISGGYLVQTKDVQKLSDATWKVVTKAPLPATLHDSALFGFEVVRAVKSNAIVLIKDGATIGIGAGQMSRVDSVRIAIEKAQAHGHDTKGALLASDAFFPFADNVALAKEAGIAAVVQPGGSVRDAEVIAAADEAGIAMVFTGSRHFKH